MTRQLTFSSEGFAIGVLSLGKLPGRIYPHKMASLFYTGNVNLLGTLSAIVEPDLQVTQYLTTFSSSLRHMPFIFEVQGRQRCTYEDSNGPMRQGQKIEVDD